MTECLTLFFFSPKQYFNDFCYLGYTFKIIFYLFIFYCTESLFLHKPFSSCGTRASHCGAGALGHAGFNGCSSQDPGHGLNNSDTWFLAAPQHVASSWIRDETHISCIGRQILHHWATREAQGCIFLNQMSLLMIFCTLQFSGSIMSNSLWPHGLKHASLPVHQQLPTFSQTHVHWLGDAINHLILCHPLLLHCQSFPVSESFQMIQFFTSGGQSTGASASASVLPMNIQDWFPLGWTGWISLQSKGISRVFSNTTVQKHHFFGT